MRPFAGSTWTVPTIGGAGETLNSSEEKPMPQAPARRDTSESSDVAKLVRLHHRRRGWAWVAIGSVIGLVVYAGIGANLFGNLTGTAETLSVIPVFVLLALVLAGLVVVIVDTSRIRRADAAVRVSAKGSVSHYPLYAHAHRYPPRHHGSWVFAIVMLVAMTGITVFILPAEVNSWAYAVGAENQDTFNPVSYGQACTPPRRRLPHGDRRLPFQKRRGRHLGQPGATRPAVQCPRPALGLGHRADPHQRRRLGDPDDRRGPVLRWSNAPAAVRPRRGSARHAVDAKPADARARWRRSGRSPPNTSSQSRSPRQRRSSPCPPQARQALTMCMRAARATTS